MSNSRPKRSGLNVGDVVKTWYGSGVIAGNASSRQSIDIAVVLSLAKRQLTTIKLDRASLMKILFKGGLQPVEATRVPTNSNAQRLSSWEQFRSEIADIYANVHATI